MHIGRRPKPSRSCGRYFWAALLIIAFSESGVSDSISTFLPLINMVGVCCTPFWSAAAFIEVTQSAWALLFTQVLNASGRRSSNLCCQLDQLGITPLQRVVGEQPEIVRLTEAWLRRRRPSRWPLLSSPSSMKDIG